MSEENKKSRKPHTPNLESIIAAIERGAYDKVLGLLVASVEERREHLKGEVLEHVRQVFGKDAEIVSSKKVEFLSVKRVCGLEGDEGKETVDNPFVKKSEAQATRPAPPPPPTRATADQLNEERVTKDSLENMQTDAGLPVSEVERRMLSGEQVVDIEHRGAIISGLSSSDIGD